MHGSDTSTPALTALDKNQDNFEALLLLLLQAYTLQNKQASFRSNIALGDLGISGEALDTLSAEQVQALVTSNSVNYEVIQQILTQQKSRPSSLGSLNSTGQFHGGTASMEAVMDEMYQRDSIKSPTVGRQSPSSSLLSVPDTNQQLQQLIQITPQQLCLLQSQVNDLLNSQHISLPPDLSPDQQQQLIQTLLLRQLHLQQSGGVAPALLLDKASASSGDKAPSHGGSLIPEGVGATMEDVLSGTASNSSGMSGTKKVNL